MLRACGDASVAGSVLVYESRVLGSGPGGELPFLTVHLPQNLPFTLPVLYFILGFLLFHRVASALLAILPGPLTLEEPVRFKHTIHLGAL